MTSMLYMYCFISKIIDSLIKQKAQSVLELSFHHDNFRTMHLDYFYVKQAILSSDQPG